MSTPTAAETFTPLDDPDPATPGDPFTRVRYSYGQLLGAEDFTVEQRYFLLRSRLHNAALHGFGTVWGLRVDSQESETALTLTCDGGLAIDPLGREIYLPQTVCLDITGLAGTGFWADLSAPPPLLDPDPNPDPDPNTDPASDPNSDPDSDPAPGDEGGNGSSADDTRRRVYVVLRYRACLTEPIPAITAPCSGQDAGLAPSRVQDGYRLCLEAAPPDLTGLPIRDITLRAGALADPRASLLEHILDPTTPPPARLWSGSDDAPLLLAVVDLEPVGTPVERVRLTGPIDNSPRALLPAVQTLADLALGIRLEGGGATPRFQAAGLRSRAGAGADAGRSFVELATTRPILAASLSADSVQVLRFDEAGAQWLTPAIASTTPSPEGLLLAFDEDWPAGTPVQLVIRGTGPQAVLDEDHRPLAGALGETVPAGAGRDASLFTLHPTTA